MELAQRLDLLVQLQAYIIGNDAEWQAAKEKAYTHNAWFIPQFIELSAKNIATHLLTRSTLQQWVDNYNIPARQANAKTIGVVMPGNIPMAGFYDLLCVFLTGHRQRIKLSPVDEVLIRHLVMKMTSWDASVKELVSFEDMLKGCDAYLATRDKSTASLKKYFGRYPHIIHQYGHGAAILYGNETRQQLELLADDVFQYFGRGCLNITKLHVPQQYDFIPLLKVFDKYSYLIDHNKYKNNYDYQLSLLILNKEFYMTNGSILLTESAAAAAPVARLHFEYYTPNEADVEAAGSNNPAPQDVQTIAGANHMPFGRAQQSVVCDQGRETLKFLLEL